MTGSFARRFWMIVFVLAAGCLALNTATAAEATSPQDAWASVLRDRVDAQGQVDFAAIQRDPAMLDRYVAFIAATPPGRIADRRERLAYLVNSYNALAMAHVIGAGVPQGLSLVGRVRFFKLSRETVGSQRISLYDYENDVIRPVGDERVHFALNCMSVSCPRLPRVPFTGEGLDAELDAAARLFFAESRNVQVNDARRVVRLSAILDFYTADFLQHAPTLIAYVNKWRSTPIPADYKVEFLDYDWTINRQPGSS